eukprot:UN13746
MCTLIKYVRRVFLNTYRWSKWFMSALVVKRILLVVKAKKRHHSSVFDKEEWVKPISLTK